MKEIFTHLEPIPYNGIDQNLGVNFVCNAEKKYNINNPYDFINTIHNTNLNQKVFKAYGEKDSQLKFVAIDNLGYLLEEQFKNRMMFLLDNAFINIESITYSLINDAVRKENVDIELLKQGCVACRCEDCATCENYSNYEYEYSIHLRGIPNFLKETFPQYFNIEQHLNGIFLNPAILMEIANLIISYIASKYGHSYAETISIDAFGKIAPEFSVLVIRELDYINTVVSKELPYYLKASILGNDDIKGMIQNRQIFK